MSETTITVTTWTCDVCGAETTSGSRPDGWLDLTFWHNPGPDSRVMIGAACVSKELSALVKNTDPLKVP